VNPQKEAVQINSSNKENSMLFHKYLTPQTFYFRRHCCGMTETKLALPSVHTLSKCLQHAAITELL
jgi:hypothetical protein